MQAECVVATPTSLFWAWLACSWGRKGNGEGTVLFSFRTKRKINLGSLVPHSFSRIQEGDVNIKHDFGVRV